MRRLALEICGHLVGATEGENLDELRRMHIDRAKAGINASEPD